MDPAFFIASLCIGLVVMLIAHFGVVFKAFSYRRRWGMLVLCLPFGDLAFWAKVRGEVAPWIYAQFVGALLTLPFYATNPTADERAEKALLNEVQQEKREAKADFAGIKKRLAVQDVLLRERESLNSTERELSLAWYAMLKQRRLLMDIAEEPSMEAYRDDLAAYEMLVRHMKREQQEIQADWNKLGTGEGSP